MTLKTCTRCSASEWPAALEHGLCPMCRAKGRDAHRAAASDSCTIHPDVFHKHCPACAQDAADALLGLGALRDTWREKAEALAESVAAYEAANTALREEVRNLKAERDEAVLARLRAEREVARLDSVLAKAQHSIGALAREVRRG